MLMSSTDMNMPVMSTASGTPQPPPPAGFGGAGAATGAGAAVAVSAPTSMAMIPVSHARVTTHVMLCQSAGNGFGAGDELQFGDLAPQVEIPGVREPVQHRRHPPREPLHAPHPPQRGGGVGGERALVLLRVPGAEGAVEHLHV